VRTRIGSVATVAGVLAVMATSAQAATGPDFVGTPSVRYAGATIAIIARLDAPLRRPSTAGFYVAPALKAGQRMGSDVFGGNPPGTIGRRDRHCYAAEALQPRPRARLRDGAHWRVGLAVAATRLIHARRVTLVRARGDAGAWERAEARRLGCDA